MKEKEPFEPFVPAEEVRPELTGASLVTGVVLAVVFGAANAYLGLRVGMTVSASIPAAVLAMGVIRIAMRKDSVLESNMVQTTGSAGESLASGVIFTLPALFLWAAEGKLERPGILEITLIATLGGLLGVFFMIPLRRTLIVREHGVLPYPEGTACAQVLLAGEKGSSGAFVVFAGMGVSAVSKWIIDGLKLVPGEVILRFRGYAGEIGMQIYPAVVSVGYICGSKIASYMFAGGLVSWMVLIPGIVLFGGGTILHPEDVPVMELFASGGAGAIWSAYIRYIGAGALAAGGVISILKSLPLIARTVRETVAGMGGDGRESRLRTQKDLDTRLVLAVIVLLTLLVWLLPVIPVGFGGAVLVIVFAFFFAAVSSRMVGLVGSSNNPISGMAIATLLVASVLLKAAGEVGIQGMHAAIAIGSVICIVSAIAGDTSQDLKTGYLLGATPRKQQIGEIIGVAAAALAIGGTLYLLDAAWGFGSEELAAPQAMLMKMIVEGVMENSLSWPLVFMGAFLAVAIQVLGIPVLPFAIGLYLPVQLSACVMAGALIRLAFEKRKKPEEEKKRAISAGILYCSGMIAGEGLAGILLALLAVLGLDGLIDISGVLVLPGGISELGSLLLFGLVVLSLVWCCLWRKEKSEL